MGRRTAIWACSVLAVLLAFAAPVAANDSTLTLRSGDLTVEINRDPFSLAFVDEGSGRVLRSQAAGGNPVARYGALGYGFDFRRAVINNAFLGYYLAAEAHSPWFHATRVLDAERDGGALVLRLATNDPLGHELEARITPTDDGVANVESRLLPGSGPLADEASTVGMSFERPDGERFLGFGERSNAVDQTGRRVFSWAEEGPFSSGEGEALVRPLIPEFTFPTGNEASNFPIPWTITTRGFGVLVDQYERSTFRLAQERSDAWRLEAEAERLSTTVFAGPTPAKVLRRYSDYAGRQPRPSDWFFGPWFQPTLEREPYELVDRFRDEDIPVTVTQTYRHYLPCGDHVGIRDQERERVRELHRRGYRVTTYFNPHVCTDYQPVYDKAASRGYFVENEQGAPYILSNPFTADEQVSEIDFTNPAAARFYGRLLDEAIDDGFDGWMEDFGEYTPTDSVFSNGRTGLQMHNRYPVIYHRASRQHTDRRFGAAPAVFVRSGYHGVQPQARIVWGGDPTEDWSCSDGLCAALHQGLSVGLSGIAYWGSDIGGFHSIVNPRTSDELNIRWLELGAVSGIMRTQANGFSVRDNRADRSQVWHDGVVDIWRRYAKLRTQLLPYLLAASEDYRRTALPIMRQLALVYPEDPIARRSQSEFMFGPDLFAAPVVEEGATSRRFYLPRGRWVDLWRSARYREADGSLRLGRTRTLDGGRSRTLPAPLDELPLLARAGTILPLLPPDTDTVSGIDRGRGVVDATERANRMNLIAFPRGRSDAALPDRARIRSVERPGRRWTLDLPGDGRRTYRLQAALDTLRDGFRPCRVEIGGDPLDAGAWNYNGRSRVIEARFDTRGEKFVVAGCPGGGTAGH